MKNMSAFRLTAICCIYFAAIGLFEPFASSVMPAAAVAGLIFAASLLAVRLEKPWARLLISLIPFAGLLFSKGIVQAIACAVPPVAACILLTSGAFSRELWLFKREFTGLCAISAVLFIVSFNPFSSSDPTRIFVVFAMLLAVLALRTGRAGSERSFRWQAGSIALFLIPAALAAAVGMGIGFALPHMKVLAAIFGVPWAFLMMLVYKIGAWFTSKIPENAETVLPTIEPIHMEGGSGQVVESTQIAHEGLSLDLHLETIPWKWIVLGAVILIGAVILTRYLIKNSERTRTVKNKLELRTQDDERTARGRRKRRKRGAGNSEMVREIYSQYMAYLRTNGVYIGRNNTTEDISGGAKLVAGDDSTLREIYRKARYGEFEVTDEEYKAAREWYLNVLAEGGSPAGEKA